MDPSVAGSTPCPSRSRARRWARCTDRLPSPPAPLPRGEGSFVSRSRDCNGTAQGERHATESFRNQRTASRARSRTCGVGTEVRTQGTVVSVTDGICRVHGLADVMQGEMLEFPGNTFGLALNLERDSVGAVVLGEYEHITEGDTVKCTGRILEVPVGPELHRPRGQLARPADRRQGPDQRQADRRRSRRSRRA